MFAIIISEKGGAERKESFDKNEINVGRVQGNDLMLPKGNVSKHHARLLFRDGRFIVTDLKSTNGTYVNGRKIAQATIVREGDKIYIGDFVLRLESAGGASSSDVASGQMSPSEEVPAALPPKPPAPPPAATMKAPTHPPGAPLPRPQPQNVSGPAGFPGLRSPETASDADDSSVPGKPSPPTNPPLPPLPPIGGRPMTAPLNQMSPAPIGGGRPPVNLQATLGSPHAAPLGPIGGSPLGAAASPPLPIAPVPTPKPNPLQRSGGVPAFNLERANAPTPDRAVPAAAEPPSESAEARPAAQPASVRPGRATAPPPRVPPKETPAQAGRRLALMTLLDRIADAIDLAPLAASAQVSEPFAQQVERVAKEQANAMRDEGDAPEGIELEVVVRDAQRELTGLGAFAGLLDDEEVGEIHCVRFDQVFTVRGGPNATLEPIAFSSEEALARVIARLAQQSGEPWNPGENVLERRLARATIVAIAPPAAANHVVSIRKRRRIETTLDELTRAGSLSKGMAQFLEACVAARVNVLVSGNTPLPLVSALAASAPAGERVVVVQDVEEIGVGGATAATLSTSASDDTIRAAAKLRADRLVVTQLTGSISGATIDAIAEGSDGVLAALPAPTLRQGISRLVTQLVLHRPGLALESVREVVGDAFDIAIETSAYPDGRLRISRIAELGGADTKGIVVRDVFVFAPDAAGDGAFNATGVVPRIATELAARGTKLDGAIFKRSGR